jgi:hypothetical protein
LPHHASHAAPHHKLALACWHLIYQVGPDACDDDATFATPGHN